jgi:hypothetical protein
MVFGWGRPQTSFPRSQRIAHLDGETQATLLAAGQALTLNAGTSVSTAKKESTYSENKQ